MSGVEIGPVNNGPGKNEKRVNVTHGSECDSVVAALIIIQIDLLTMTMMVVVIMMVIMMVAMTHDGGGHDDDDAEIIMMTMIQTSACIVSIAHLSEYGEHGHDLRLQNFLELYELSCSAERHDSSLTLPKVCYAYLVHKRPTPRGENHFVHPTLCHHKQVASNEKICYVYIYIHMTLPRLAVWSGFLRVRGSGAPKLALSRGNTTSHLCTLVSLANGQLFWVCLRENISRTQRTNAPALTARQRRHLC